jgi:hypothetical protein
MTITEIELMRAFGQPAHYLRGKDYHKPQGLSTFALTTAVKYVILLARFTLATVALYTMRQVAWFKGSHSEEKHDGYCLRRHTTSSVT